MNFLEAKKLAATASCGLALPFLFAMSGTHHTLDVYLRAHAARHRRSAEPRTLPFNTLPQTLLTQPVPGEREVFLLMPWDLSPELDWRTGIPLMRPTPEALRQSALECCQRLKSRPNAALLYMDASIPPVLGHPREDAYLRHSLAALAGDTGAVYLPAGCFSLSAYLAHGTPFGGGSLSAIAQAVINAALGGTAAAKVLVTDLDNTLWKGIVGEDGVDGVDASPQASGFRHFLYQSFLGALQRRGILLAAVSRNDPDLARAPLQAGRMVLREDQFVAVSASYHAKSGQIRGLSESLGLGLDAFVFVDDNPVELEEVGRALPEVTCLPFPETEDGLPKLLDALSERFPRLDVTAEDGERTALYRRRVAGMVPKDLSGADVTAFLRDLRMALEIRDQSCGDRQRAVQLINKTNQFNLNGRRWADDEIDAELSQGARLYTASLTDRHGAHGEIFACLVRPTGQVPALVMSCRVLQRRVEHAVLAWLLDHLTESAGRLRLLYKPTERNTPLRLFLEELELLPRGGDVGGGELLLAADERMRASLQLFELRAA